MSIYGARVKLAHVFACVLRRFARRNVRDGERSALVSNIPLCVRRLFGTSPVPFAVVLYMLERAW